MLSFGDTPQTYSPVTLASFDAVFLVRFLAKQLPLVRFDHLLPYEKSS